MADHITIKLDRSDEVIDFGDFAAMFAGPGTQFEDDLKEKHPEVHGHARMGIREMRRGSIIAELAAVIMPTALATTDGTVIVRDFTLLLKDRYDTLADGQFLAGGKKRETCSLCGCPCRSCNRLTGRSR